MLETRLSGDPGSRSRAPIANAIGVAAITLLAIAGAGLVARHVAHRAAGDSNPAYERPMESVVDGVRHVVNRGARVRLRVDNTLGGKARLLFLDGRSASPLGDGRSAWPDAANGRVVVFEPGGPVTRELEGSPDGRRVLARPLAVVRMGQDLLAAEGDGAALRFHDGVPRRWIQSEATRGVIGAGSRDVLVASRTIDEIELAPVQTGEPLMWLLDAEGRVVRTIGTVDVPANPFLGQLVNAGSVATDDDGNIYFAFALRREVRRYRADGQLEWVSTLPLAPVPLPPTLAAPNGAVRPVFTIVQHALTVDAGGRVYVLGAGGDGGKADHVYVFDTDGRLTGQVAVPPGAAVFGDDRSRLTTREPQTALARAAGAERSRFAEFALPALLGTDTVRSADYAGRVVVVGFWASWCAPCRREMPQLDRLARELSGRGVSVIGLNEDTSPDAARQFVKALGIGYPSAMGKGNLREQYGYRGLPYTVVLDREHQIVRAMYGFGDSIEPLRRILIEELARPTSSSQTHRDSSTTVPTRGS